MEDKTTVQAGGRNGGTGRGFRRRIGIGGCSPPPLLHSTAWSPMQRTRIYARRWSRPSPIPHGPAMNPGQREHRRRELLDRRISPPLEESRRWAWWAETPVLVDAKPGGSPYVHCESTGKSGGSLRAHRNFPVFPLSYQGKLPPLMCSYPGPFQAGFGPASPTPPHFQPLRAPPTAAPCCH